MATTRVPTTFGLMERTKMNTYYVKKYDGAKWHTDIIKAQNINNLRKRLWDENRGELYHVVTVKVKKGKAPGSPLEEVGQLFTAINGGKMAWMWADRKSHHHRVSTKTGNLLDYNKYWRYV